MNVFARIIDVLWLLFYFYWLVNAWGNKRSVRTAAWLPCAAFRLLIIIGIVTLVRAPWFRNALPTAAQISPLVKCAGAVLCAMGLGFAVWARRHLGRNWGVPMSMREGHELITTGPYTYVRHPIYTGILTALLASSFVQPRVWSLPFVVAFVYFVYSAFTEDKLMLEKFPGEYPDYRRRTKMLIPFVL